MDHLIEHIRYGVFSAVVFRAHPVHIFHGCGIGLGGAPDVQNPPRAVH